MMTGPTHAHYDDEAFDEDREALLSGLAAGGIGTVVNAEPIWSTKTTIELTKGKISLYLRRGSVHPSSTAELDEENLPNSVYWHSRIQDCCNRRWSGLLLGRARIMRHKENGSTAN